MAPLLALPSTGIGTPSTDEVGDLIADAKIGVLEEIDLLAELDALRSVPIVVEISDRVPTDETTRDELIRRLDEIDEDNVDLLDDLLSAGLPLSDPVVLALDALDERFLDGIDEGRTEFLEPGLWLDALVDLWERDGDAPAVRERVDRSVLVTILDWAFPGAPGDDLGSLPEVTAVVTGPDDAATVSEVATEPAPGVGSGDGTITTRSVAPPDDGGIPAVAALLVGLGGGGLLLVVALLARRGRSRPANRSADATGPTRSTTERLDALLESSRRMTAALDGDEVRRIAVRDAMRLAGAEAGAFLPADEEQRFTEALPAGTFSDRPVTDGLLLRVLDSGQSACTIVEHDPALVSAPVAMAAVPVITGGGVAGALVVVRSADEPFGPAEVAALAQLAPIVGSALGAAEEHRTAMTDAERDGLTSLLNRRRLDRDLAAADGAPIAFAMVDVDHFKRFNDVHGHQAGDDALRTVAEVLAATVRLTDVVYRYGGEEFSVLLRDTTVAQASEVLERVREAVEATEIEAADGRLLGSLTISVGVVATVAPDESPSELPHRADRALYDAKADGRNQVVVGA
ncbi:MAG: sensor domain-containing diguanylate cyclase [Actinomycetota bacterium]